MLDTIKAYKNMLGNEEDRKKYDEAWERIFGEKDEEEIKDIKDRK